MGRVGCAEAHGTDARDTETLLLDVARSARKFDS